MTHVLVDDPTKGYGIFIETKLDTAAYSSISKAHTNGVGFAGI